MGTLFLIGNIKEKPEAKRSFLAKEPIKC